jgi:hypothetical protein
MGRVRAARAARKKPSPRASSPNRFTESEGGELREDDPKTDEAKDKEPFEPEISESPPLACPFRKRNPSRFNVRDSSSCSLEGFASASNLKYVKARDNIGKLISI